jgi:hypothetical protein
MKLEITMQLLQMNQITWMHFSWFSITSHYIGAWKHLVMVGGTFGMKATCFWGDCGISEQQDQVLKSIFTCCLEMLVCCHLWPFSDQIKISNA